VHGGFFVLSHFHYTIMGGLNLCVHGRTLLLAAQDDWRVMNKRLGLWHFWTMFVFFNLTFFPMFIIGLLGQPRRVFTYAKNLQTLNDFSSISAFLLGASFLIFFANPHVVPVHQSEEVTGNPWESLGLEWQTATPIPPHNFDRIRSL